MYHIFFIHSSADGHLGCFQVLAIVDSVAMNTGVHVSFLIRVLSGYMPRSVIAGSHGLTCTLLMEVFHNLIKKFHVYTGNANSITKLPNGQEPSPMVRSILI